ncbi:MAG: SpoIID/LytB domain-containing protein [Candidatus Acidiferrales bacterium]
MKALRIVYGLALLAVVSCSARGQDVRVGVYTIRPPVELNIRATAATLRWRACATCAESSGVTLDLHAEESEVAAGQTGRTPELFVTGPYRLEAADLQPISAQFPLRIAAREGRLQVVATLPLEDYVAMVLTAESGDLAGDEAMKAMAVSVRSYAVRFRGRHAAEGFDFCDNTHCQVVSWTTPISRAVAAAAATRSLLLWYNGEVAETYYHQNCGGTLASASEVWPGENAPYLRTHADPYCVQPQPQTWESTISIADIDAALRASGFDVPRGWTTLEIASRSESGRVARLRLTGGSPPAAELSGSSFRFAVDRALGWNKIRSDLYSVRAAPDRLVFSGRGTGHGVGLCQAGADEMAREGKDYKQILSFYYPGTQLGAHPAIAWQTRSSEHIELQTLAPDQDSAILPIAARLLTEDERAIGWQISFKVRLQIYPTLDLYRDATGQPGWVAATTRGQTIRLQPLTELRAKNILESTLRHELFHLLVESRARPDTPVWFREGVVLYLTGPAPDENLAPGGPPTSISDDQLESIFENSQDRTELQRAYTAAQARVAALIAQYGKDAVLGWLSGGLPAGINTSRGAGPEH